MPDSEDTANDPEQSQVLKEALGVFLDMIVQLVALQFALVDAHVVTWDRVEAHAKELNQRPAIQKARGIYGTHSEVLEALLRSYKGPVQ